jgi:MFS family permease
MSGVSGEIFDAGPVGLSLLLGSIGAGALLSSLWLARRGEMVGLTKLVTLSVLGCGLALTLAMTLGQLWVAVVFLMVLGGFMLIGNVGAQSLIQNTVDSQIRARVLSLFIVFAHGLPAVGALLIGWIASYAGLQITLAVSGLALAVVWLWARLRTAKMAAILEKAHTD